jgi:hypothetical protein
MSLIQQVVEMPSRPVLFLLNLKTKDIQAALLEGSKLGKAAAMHFGDAQWPTNCRSGS